MIIRCKHIYRWLLDQKTTPIGLEIVYGNNKHEIVGVSCYTSPDGIILRHPIPTLNKKEEIKNHVFNQYGFTILEPDGNGDVKEITHKYYYKNGGVWMPNDNKSFVGLCLGDEIKILNKFYDEEYMLKPVF